MLAALVNADALVERAERKPLGPGRDRSLAIWHPVQDIANITQISRLRDLGDWVVGNEDEGGSGRPARMPGPPPRCPPTPCGPRCGRRRADEPLRVYIGGDSIIRDAGDAFLNLASDSPLFDTTLHYENATGLTRPDFYDWPAALAEDMDDPPTRGGVHPLRGQRLPGDPRARTARRSPGPSDPRWREEYARRVAGVMDILRADDRIVFWVGLPPMRDDGFDGRAEIMNDIYREAAESRPWMTYLDTDPIFGDDDGEYVERKPDHERRPGGPPPGGRRPLQPAGRHPAGPGDARPDRRGDPGEPQPTRRRRRPRR